MIESQFDTPIGYFQSDIMVTPEVQFQFQDGQQRDDMFIIGTKIQIKQPQTCQSLEYSITNKKMQADHNQYKQTTNNEILDLNETKYNRRSFKRQNQQTPKFDNFFDEFDRNFIVKFQTPISSTTPVAQAKNKCDHTQENNTIEIQNWQNKQNLDVNRIQAHIKEFESSKKSNRDNKGASIKVNNIVFKNIQTRSFLKKNNIEIVSCSRRQRKTHNVNIGRKTLDKKMAHPKTCKQMLQHQKTQPQSIFNSSLLLKETLKSTTLDKWKKKHDKVHPAKPHEQKNNIFSRHFRIH